MKRFFKKTTKSKEIKKESRYEEVMRLQEDIERYRYQVSQDIIADLIISGLDLSVNRIFVDTINGYVKVYDEYGNLFKKFIILDNYEYGEVLRTEVY